MILIMMSCSSNMSNNTLDAGIVVMLLCISYGWLSGVFGTILYNCGVSEEIRLRDDEEKSTSIVFFHDDDSNSYPKISSGDVGKATDTRIESTTLLSIVVEVYNFRRTRTERYEYEVHSFSSSSSIYEHQQQSCPTTWSVVSLVVGCHRSIDVLVSSHGCEVLVLEMIIAMDITSSECKSRLLGICVAPYDADDL